MILALDLYYRVDPLRVGPEHPEVILLSQRLCSFPFHPPGVRANTFRNPTGIVMTLRTLMRYDTSLGLRGLRGGKLGRELWNEFNQNRPELHQFAQAIVTAAKALQMPGPAETDEERFEEGGVLFRLHRLRERNRRLVARKKERVLQNHGTLACEVCGFDFAAAYGPWGEGYVECHHRKPLSELPARGTVRLDDLALVCANCHRILHRRNPMPTVDQLTAAVRRT